MFIRFCAASFFSEPDGQAFNSGVKLGRGGLNLALVVILFDIHTDMLAEFDERTLLVQQLEPGAFGSAVSDLRFVDGQLADGCPVMAFKLIGAELGPIVCIDRDKVLEIGKADGREFLQDAIGRDVKDMLGPFSDSLLEFFDPCRNLEVLHHLDRASVHGLGLG